jgi:hypothetical protein
MTKIDSKSLSLKKRLKAFFKHSHISIKLIRRYESQSFCYVGRLYAGYVELYACTKGKVKHLYITVWLFFPTNECRKLMVHQNVY